MSGMWDATCPKCCKRFGWSGKLTDKPNCPKCNHPPDLKSLRQTEAKMRRDREEMIKRMEAEDAG